MLSALLLIGCGPRILLRPGMQPVQPLDDLEFGGQDTVVTGTLTMLSPKLQALDLVEIRGDTAFRRARMLLEPSVVPYYGGIIQARVKPSGEDSAGYMKPADLLEWKEYPVDRSRTRKTLQRALAFQRPRFDSLVSELGFEEWNPEGVLQLEGFDPQKDICIYSIAGKAVKEGIKEKKPLLIVRASLEGKLSYLALGTTGSVLERRRK